MKRSRRIWLMVAAVLSIIMLVAIAIMMFLVREMSVYSSENANSYTDAQAETIAQRLTTLTPKQDTNAATFLREVGIDKSRLKGYPGGAVGNCYLYSFYDLSNSYVLLVDDNSCYGGRAFVIPKPDCSSGPVSNYVADPWTAVCQPQLDLTLTAESTSK